MAFSSGTYSLPGPALNTGDTVSATENNTFRNDVATAFNLTMLRNGTSTATANLPMGGFKLTGLGLATTSGDALSYGQAATVSDLTVTGSVNSPNTFGFKNRIINPGMVIDQRNAGASVTPTDGQYTVDRWVCGVSQASKFTVQQSSTAPTGFTKSVVITSSSAYSSLSTDLFIFRQNIEGFNTADLAWGTASAASVTLSFWVRSSLTGQFGGALSNAATNRSYPFSFTISSANTWEQKTITIAGDQSGTWATDNTQGVRVTFDLGSGSNYLASAGTWAGSSLLGATGDTKLVGTNGATLYITGVQLEKGSTATSFDFRSYGTELALCQRYYEKSCNIDVAPANGVLSSDRKQGCIYTSSGGGGYYGRFAVPKRATPTITLYNGADQSSAGVWGYFDGTAWQGTTLNSSLAKQTDFLVDFSASGRSLYQAVILDGNWTASAEL